jgi:hypothetical protein
MPVIVPKVVLQQSIGAVAWLFAATEQQWLVATQEDHKMAKEKWQCVLAFVGNQVERQVAVTTCCRNVWLLRSQSRAGADLQGLHAGPFYTDGVLPGDGGGAPR